MGPTGSRIRVFGIRLVTGDPSVQGAPPGAQPHGKEAASARMWHGKEVTPLLSAYRNL